VELPRQLIAALGPDPAAAITAMLANPLAGVTLDRGEKYLPFAGSVIEKLRPYRVTERELVDEAVGIDGRTVQEIAKAGLLREAATIVQNEFRRKETRRSKTTGPLQGLEGARDHELTNAIKRLIKSEGRVTPSLLRKETGVAFRTCRRTLERLGARLGLVEREDGVWRPAGAAAIADR
jgi:hypothetical protein